MADIRPCDIMLCGAGPIREPGGQRSGAPLAREVAGTGEEEMESTLLATAQTERRRYRRLAIRLPMEYSPAGQGEAQRTTTSNISTSGLYFEVHLTQGTLAPELNSLLNVSLTIPPGDGYFPYAGQVTGTAEVVRREQLVAHRGDTPARIGIGVRFSEPLKLAF
jgi:hypothetical protein